MLKNPNLKYRPFEAMPFSERSWPSKIMSSPPIWASSDLRDGNQAIFEPMNLKKKLQFFELLKKIGFKEIEVGFPVASKADYAFVRMLIEEDLIPDDVRIGVLTQAKEELIEKTIDSLKGAKKAILHVYAATAPEFRDVVFSKSKDEVIDMAANSVSLVKKLTQKQPATDWMLEFSPEAFSQTEMPFARDVCDAVIDAWGATAGNKIILNLPATVETCMPNQHADQIEWMCQNIKNRESAIISIHPHNDRGTGVAAAEMALLAGADRVEGCLLGNGERTGNVDLVTLALNMYSKGIHPRLDFSDMQEVVATVEACTGIPTHPRQPYAGDLVFTAFSGSHQDAIKKGMAAKEKRPYWDVPYIPIDPQDIGRSYDGLIRVNSQSGKGGIAYMLEKGYGITMPRRLQIEFSSVVQRALEASETEITTQQIWDIFQKEYMDDPAAAIRYVSHRLCHRTNNGKPQGIGLTVGCHGKEMTFLGKGNGPIDASVNALEHMVDVHSYKEHSLGQGSTAQAISYVEMTVKGESGSHFGIGIHENFVTASVLAVVSGINRGIKLGRLKLAEDFGKPQRPNNFFASQTNSPEVASVK